jgi:GT2 family glycosyltransferase
MPEATVIFPFAGGGAYADLAIDSMIRFSALPLRLMILVEPIITGSDLAWADAAASRWKHAVQVVRHEKRLGYYTGVNEAMMRCKTPVAIIFTSDQVASPEWDLRLLEWLAPGRFVTGRLIESGASLIADGNIWKKFGYDAASFDEPAFLRFCRDFAPRREIDVPRHYIPMACYVEDFKRAGLFEGGRDSTAISTYREDLYFFLRAHAAGFEVVEAQRALTYHFQHGSKRKRALWRRHLNWIYPYGLKHLHRWYNGYVSLYDSMIAQGAGPVADRVNQRGKEGAT